MPKRSPKADSFPSLPRSGEKRIHRYRKLCPAKLLMRLHRGTTQRLYLIDRSEESPDEMMFTVLGSTGNVYQVTLSHVPACTCPDFRRQADLCKHIIFVLNKVIGLGFENPLVYQRAFVTSELEQLFALVRTRHVGACVLANQRVRETYVKGATSQSAADGSSDRKRCREEVGDDCPICFDRMESSGETTDCHVCGALFHEDCILRWIGQGQRSGAPSCPNCRSAWQMGRDVVLSGEGYLNLGSLQGQPSVRDTRTYQRRRY